MPADLTPQQVTFLETFVGIPKFFGRKEAKAQRQQYEVEFGRFNVQRDFVEKRIAGLADKDMAKRLRIELDLAEEIVFAGGKKPDFDGGHLHLVAVNNTVDSQILIGRVKERLAAVQPIVTTALTSRLDKHEEINLKWEYANGLAERGIKAPSNDKMNSALVLLGELPALIKSAKPAGLPGTTGAVQGDAASVQEAKTALALARAELLAAETRLTNTEIALTATFAPSTPATLVQAIAVVRKIITDAPKEDSSKTGEDLASEALAIRTLAEAIAKAAGEAVKGLNELDAAAKTPAEQYAQWKKDLAALTPKHDTLQRHPGRAHPKVQPEVNAIANDLLAASAKLTTWDYAGAIAALSLLPGRIEAAIKLADDLAKLAKVASDRRSSVNALPQAATLDHTQAKAAVDAARKLLSDADTANTAGKIGECMGHLDKIPAAVEAADKLARLSQDYKANYTEYGKAITKCETRAGKLADPTIKASLGNAVQRVKDYWTNNACAADGDLVAAMQKLTQFWGSINSLVAQVGDAETYETELKAFKDRLKAVKEREGDNGRIAIEEYYLRLQADETFANDKATKGDYAFAAKVLKSSEGAPQTDALALADLAKDFIARKKALNEKLPELRKKTGADKAADAIARIGELVATATDTALNAKNWQGALTLIANAEKQARLAEQAITDAADIASAKDDSAHAGVTDALGVEKAFQNFTAVHGKVLSKDDGTFAAKLGTIQQKAVTAKALAGEPAKDFAKAAEGIKTALAEAEAVFNDILAKRGYADRLALVQFAHGTTLPARNTDDCIKPEIDDIGKALTEAANLAKASGLDFAGADARLTATLPIIRKAELNGAAYARLKPNRTKVRRLYAFLEEPAHKAGVDEEFKRIKAIRKEISDQIAARDLKKAEAKAKEGAGLDAGYRVIAADYVKALAERKRLVADNLKFLQGSAACAPELAQVQAMDKKIDDLMKARAYKSVAKFAGDISQIVVKGWNIKQAFGPWEIAKAAGDSAYTDIHKREKGAVPAIVALLEQLDTEYDKATAAAGERNFKTAKTWMDKVIATAGKIEPDLKKMEDCRKVRDEAGQALAQVGKLANKDVVEPLVARLTGKHQNAIRIFDAGDFPTATTSFNEIKADCQTALDAAGKQAEYAKLNGEVKALAATDTQGVKDALEKARTHIAELRALPEALYVVADVMAAETAVKAAQKALDEGSTDDTAKNKVVEAMDACARGRVNLGFYTQIASSAEYARQHVTDFLSNHTEAEFVKGEMEALCIKVDQTILALRGDPSKRSAAQTAIEEVMAEFHRLRMIADARKAYLVPRNKVVNDLLTMERDAGRYAIADEIADVRKMMETADTASESRDHDRAMKLIAQARADQLDALLKAKMTRGAVPGADEIKAILDGPGGTDRLDKIVESLDPTAQRSVLNAAFEARFGCKLNIYKDKTHETQLEAWLKLNPNASKDQIENRRNQLRAANVSPDLGKKGPNIKRFYEVMSDLPDSATLDNDSMIQFTTVEGPATGSDYGPSRKEVTMREGDANASGYYGVALPHELDNIDPDCKPMQGEEMTFFAWNTLHEVGHAVDDRAGFMDRNGKSKAGWEYYGSNVLPAAEAIAGKLEFDVGYVAAVMSGDTDPPIPEPKGCDAEEWERRRAGVAVLVGRIRHDQDPWQTASAAKAAEVGGIVYQESYENTWTSYPIDQRSKGVSGYQFRAPGEWFAELYAAYHSGKMNPSHPAAEWIKDM